MRSVWCNYKAEISSPVKLTLPSAYSIQKTWLLVLNKCKNCATNGFYACLNQVVPNTKKGSRWIKKLCANQVLYRCQAGSKKVSTGFYLGFMRVLNLYYIYGLKRVLSRLYPAMIRIMYLHNRVLYRSNIVKLGPFRHAERNWRNLSIY